MGFDEGYNRGNFNLSPPPPSADLMTHLGYDKAQRERQQNAFDPAAQGPSRYSIELGRITIGGALRRLLFSMIFAAVGFDALMVYAVWQNHGRDFTLTAFAGFTATGAVIGLLIGIVLCTVASLRRR